jgi:hypothetical protein
MIAVNDATAAMGTEPACRALGRSRAAVSGASTGRSRAPSTGATPLQTPADVAGKQRLGLGVLERPDHVASEL